MHLDRRDKLQTIIDPGPLVRSVLVKSHKNVLNHLMTCYQPAVDKALGKFVKRGHTKAEAEWLLRRHKESSDDPDEPENTEDEEIGTRDTSRS